MVDAIYAQNAPGRSALVSVTTPRALQPSSFTARLAGDNAVALSWNVPTDAVGFAIQRSDGQWLNDGHHIRGSSFTDSNAPSGSVKYTIIAYYDAAGAGEIEGELSDGVPSVELTVLPLIADGEQDFGGGKHGKVHAVLYSSGTLKATVDTWTNSPLQGFTMGVMVAVRDKYGDSFHYLAGGPFGVDGQNTPFGSAPRRTDELSSQLPTDSIPNAHELYAFVYYAPKTRIIEIATKVHTTVRDICKQYGPDNTWMTIGCKGMGF
jgi:hypothetical protein